MAIRNMGMGMLFMILAGCALEPGTMPSATPWFEAASEATWSQAKASFAVEPRVMDYTADALVKAATTLRNTYGGNARALRDSQLVVTVHNLTQDKTVIEYHASGDFSLLLTKPSITKADAKAVLAAATVSMPYPVSNNVGSFDKVPTFAATGTQATYYLRVTANSPIARQGQRAKLFETYISDYGRNFSAEVE